MVTGHDKREEVIEALQAGVDEYLVKPVSYEVLEEKIKHLLGIRIRQAGPEDAETLARLIVEFADDEQHKAAPDVAALRRHLALTANPGCAALLAEHEACGQVIGFALYFHAYSTFLTCWGIYFEDLYYGWQSGIWANWPCCVMSSQGPGGRCGNWLTETLPSQSLGT